MNKQAQREIRRSLMCILEVCLFLGVSTWFWYGPRKQLQKQTELVRKSYAYISGVELIDKKKISLDESQRQGKYTFTLKNNTSDHKEIIVSLVADNEKVEKEKCHTISNNRINYYLHQKEEQDNIRRSLSLSGNILMTTLKPQEEREYTLEYSCDNDINLKEKHFHAKAILASGKNKI